MADQTVQIPGSPNLSGTKTIKLFTVSSDTVIDTATATNGTNDGSLWSATFTDVVAARYRAVLFDDAKVASMDHVTLVDATDTYPVEGLQDPDSAVYAAVTSLQPGLVGAPVERSPEDTNLITFRWPESGATIAGTVSINNGAIVPIVGAIAFFNTEGTSHWYTLAYNVADRPATEGTARYTFTDITYTRYVNLRVGSSTDAESVYDFFVNGSNADVFKATSVALVNGSINADAFDNDTAFPVTSVDGGDTRIVRITDIDDHIDRIIKAIGTVTIEVKPERTLLGVCPPKAVSFNLPIKRN